jgi:nicotinate-nucleotide adenylyltransferase
VNIGLFGGTFDPPHIGHLIVAQDAALALGLDRILFIPAAQPPHKLERVVTPAALRARMLDLAVAGDPRYGVDRLELERPGPSYSVDTLRALRERSPDVSWTLLVGADQYADFATWRSPQEISRLARVAVLSRGLAAQSAAEPGRPAAGPAAPAVTELAAGGVQVVVTRIDISSTEVRGRVAAGLPIRYLVPAAVETFIGAAGLYRRTGPATTG